MDIVSGILADDDNEPKENEDDAETSLLYGTDVDNSMDIGGSSPKKNEEIQGSNDQCSIKRRFFIVKSQTHNDISHSYNEHEWNTTLKVKERLRDAARGSDVTLIFSVNGSRHFHGYAVISESGSGCDDSEEAKKRPISVHWIRLCHLPYPSTNHVLNTMNHDKPVKVSKNGQELDMQAATTLISLIDQSPPETLESQRAKLAASDKNLSIIATQRFPLPPTVTPEEVRAALIPVKNQERETNGHDEDSRRDSKDRDRKSRSERDRSEGRDDGKRRRGGRDRERDEDRGGAGSYLDMMDIANMTYEEYLEAYRALQHQAREEYMMMMMQPPMGMMGGDFYPGGGGRGEDPGIWEDEVEFMVLEGGGDGKCTDVILS